MKKIKLLILALITLSFSIMNVKADEAVVAQIGENKYTSLDTAIEEANEGDIIEILNNVETIGINLSKDLTIKSVGEEKYTITFTDKGIALWGKSLTFSNVNIIMDGIGTTPYTAEWNWVTICASQNAELNLIDSVMKMDGTGTSNNSNKTTHAIYFTGNDKLNLTNSVLEIKNYSQDALEWDSGDGGYNINLINSKYLSDNNRSGFTGTFVVKAIDSNIDVINSTANGSNGSHFEFINSTVNFNNNKSHGLSAGNLIINNSKVTANGNGANGIHTTGEFKVLNNSEVTITNNNCSISSKWTIPGALFISGNGIIDKSTNLTITNNNGSGIYVKLGGSLDLQTGVITKNIAEKLGFGGGINNSGTITIAEGVEIYNNYASKYGDDIYSDGTISISNVVTDKNLIELREDNKVLNDCNDKINGWYDDSEDLRWTAHEENYENNHILLFEAGTYTDVLAVKAAHDARGVLVVNYVDIDNNKLDDEQTYEETVGTDYTTEEKEFFGYELVKVEGNTTGKYGYDTIYVTYIYKQIKGVLVVRYVDEDGNLLTEELTSEERVGTKYTTEEKEFMGYTFFKVEGNTTGEYTKGTTYVTYIYKKNIGNGDTDILPPQTGVETNLFSITKVEMPKIYKKKEELI